MIEDADMLTFLISTKVVTLRELIDQASALINGQAKIEAACDTSDQQAALDALFD